MYKLDDKNEEFLKLMLRKRNRNAQLLVKKMLLTSSCLTGQNIFWLSILYLIIQHCLQLIVKYKTNINFQHWTTSSVWLHKMCTYPHVRSKLYGVKIDFYQNRLEANSNY